MNVFVPKCQVCHNENGQASFLDLSSREVFLANDFLFDTENPGGSYLVEVIEDPEEPMPPTWSNIPVLTDEEKQKVREWIGAGLP